MVKRESLVSSSMNDKTLVFKVLLPVLAILLFATSFAGEIVGEKELVIEADSISLVDDHLIEAVGHVSLERKPYQIKVERLGISLLENKIEANSSVRVEHAGNSFISRLLFFDVDDSILDLIDAKYTVMHPFKIENARNRQIKRDLPIFGQANRVQMKGQSHYVLTNGTATTCKGSDPDWHIAFDEVEIDSNQGEGSSKGTVLLFKDKKILGWQHEISFPLFGQARSGFLGLTYGTTNTSGLEVSIPFYWRIAPNKDVILISRLLSRRGVQLGAEGRYLGHGYQGSIYHEYLNDSLLRRSRWLLDYQHLQQLSDKLSLSLDLNSVSDNHYFRDLSKPDAAAPPNLLKQEIRLDYQENTWNVVMKMNRHQVVESPSLSIPEPYRRLPQIQLSTYAPASASGIKMTSFSEVTFFDSDNIRGNRFVFRPDISLKFRKPTYSLTPKVGLYAVKYADLRSQKSIFLNKEEKLRVIPTFSISGSSFLEKTGHFFSDSLRYQLQPRFFYVHTPYVEQNGPVFDTSSRAFSRSSLFSENRYLGQDRVGDDHHVTLALSGNVIDPKNGKTLLSGLLGQRFYLAKQRHALPALLDRKGRVLLPKESLRPAGSTDIIAMLSMETETIRAGLEMEFDIRLSEVTEYSQFFQYQPSAGKVISFAYRFSERDRYKQADISSQWPLSQKIHAIGRYNYSFLDKRPIDMMLGLEYNAGCWVFRSVFRRQNIQRQSRIDSVFLEVELNGLSSLGNDPIPLLREYVPGYIKTNHLPYQN